MTARVRVRVPASTSNVGAGFDCVGIAVDRWLALDATIARDGPLVSLERRGTLREVAVPAEEDLIYRGFASACSVAGRPAPQGVVLRAVSRIPVARGLGSSAAALVAGIAAANALCDLDLSGDAVFKLAAELDGHPDNVAPIVYGGATLVVPGQHGAPAAVALEVHPSLTLVFAVPAFAVETVRARGILPGVVAFETTVSAVARAAALVGGLARADATLLAAALDDVLHVPHRRALIPGYEAVVLAARAAGAYGATLSGSGSSIVGVAAAERAGAVGRAMARAWRANGVRVGLFEARRPAPRYDVRALGSRKTVNV